MRGNEKVCSGFCSPWAHGLWLRPYSTVGWLLEEKAAAETRLEELMEQWELLSMEMEGGA